MKLFVATTVAFILSCFLSTSHASPLEPVVMGPINVDCQVHWSREMMQHLHTGYPDAPLYKTILGGQFTLLNRIQLYHTNVIPVAISYLSAGRFPTVQSQAWDTSNGGPGLSEPGVIYQGDPNGLKIANGTIVHDTALWHPDGLNGGNLIESGVEGFMPIEGTDRHDDMRASLELPVVARVDTSKPENPELPLVCRGWARSGMLVNGQLPPEVGSLIISFRETPDQTAKPTHWPTTVITSRQEIQMDFSTYGPNDSIRFLVGASRIEQINNLSIHTGVPGLLIQQFAHDATSPAATSMKVIIDPAQLNQGANTITLRGTIEVPNTPVNGEPSPFPGGEEVNVLLTMSVYVDKSGAPADSDGDLVPDSIDLCPGTPAGTPVDANGCAIAPAPPVAAMQAVLAQAAVLAQQWPEPVRSQLLGYIAAMLALIGG